MTSSANKNGANFGLIPLKDNPMQKEGVEKIKPVHKTRKSLLF